MRRTRLWRSSHERDISGNASEELGADKKAARMRETHLDRCQLIVSAQDGAWRDRQSSKQNVQRPECNACDAVHVIANQEWLGKNGDLSGRLIESTEHSSRIVEGPEDTPQL